MKPISSLFAKYQKTLRPPQASVEKQAAASITAVTGITITLEQISYQPATKTLKLQTPSIVRSELMRHKAAILRRLQAELGPKHSPTELL